MRRIHNINKTRFFFLILFLFLTSSLTLKTFREVNVKDIKIYGTKLFLTQDLVENSSLNLPTKLINIKTKYLEKELKQNLSLRNISITRQIIPFGLKVIIKTRTPVAYGEKVLNDKNILGFIDENGFFIKKEYAEGENLEDLRIKVFGWQKNFRKTLAIILASQKINDFELLTIRFSPNGFLTLEEKDLKTLFLGFNPNLIKIQLQIISTLKDQFKKNNFSKKIDNIDLTNPNNPKIKVFKP